MGSSARLVRLVAAVLVALSLVAAYGATTASAADRNFAPRFTANDTGDIDIFGNTLMTCPAAASGCAAAQQSGVTTTADATSQNNAYNMQYIDVDGDASTFNSSRSTVSLPSGSTVLFAGLYWGARTAAGSGGSAARNAAARNLVKFKAPGQANYASLTADTLDDGNGGIYQGFADVTDEVKAGGNGQYTVADVQASTGADTLAGWSLVIAYRDTTQPARNLSVFDGIKSISSGASGTINVSGFTTPPAGPVRTRVGFVNYEGDGGIVGDSASLNGTTLSDAQHPATNFFNSRSSRDGVRRTATEPNYPNQLGIEQSILLANGILGNNATSATIGLTSSGDVYAPGVVTFATELYAPKIEQTKTVTDDNGGDVEQGDTLTYTIAGKNTGQDGAANFVLRDPLPANTAYVPGSLKVTQPGGTSTTVTDGAGDDRGEYDAANRRVVTRLGTGATATAGGTIAPDASYAATFKVKVGGPSPSVASGTVLTNTATASFNSQSLGTALTTASTATSTVKSPDLTIVKKRSGELVRGSAGTYLIDVKNEGQAKTQGEVTVTDALPAGLTATAAAGPGWICTVTSGDVTCKRSDALSAGSSYPTITVTVNVGDDVPSSVANSASVAGGGDGNLGNNTSTDTSVTSSRADLALEKTRDVASPAVGGNVAYTLKVTNNGVSRSTGSVVTDTLPAGLTYVSSDAACSGSAGASAVNCTVGPLASGASASFTVTAKPASGTAGTSLKNTASVSGNENDPTPGNNSASSTVDVKPVDLVVANAIDGNPGSLSAGQTYTWNVDVKNVGGSPAGGSTLSFPVPTGTTVAAGLDRRCAVSSDGRTITCVLGTINPGDAVDPIKIPLKVADGAAAPANVSTIATAKSVEQDANVDDNSASTSTPVKSAVDLGVTLKSDPTSTSAGDTLKLTATITNNGPASPSAPKLVVPIPVNTTFVSAPAGCTYEAANSRVVCDLPAGDLGPGKSIDRTIVVKVGDTPGDSIDASASVSSGSNDTDPSNDKASLAVPVVKTAGLSIKKTASTTQAKPGDVVTYTLKATNAGPAAARDAVVTDTLPAGTTFVSATAPCTNASGKVTCDLGTIAAGDSRTVTIRAKVDPIDSSLDPRSVHDLTVTKTEVNLAVPARRADEVPVGTATARCDAGYVATDGSVRIDSVDQGTGTFADAKVLTSRATDDGQGWTGRVRNDTTGQLQTKVTVVCLKRTTAAAGADNHVHPLLVSDPVSSTQSLAAGSSTVDLTCGPGRVAIAPGYTFAGDATVRVSQRKGTGWTFTVDVPEATKATFEIRCLSTSVGVAAGHTHDLGLNQVSDSVTVPAGGTVEHQVSCGDGKGIVGSVDLDKGLVNLGNDPRPVIRDFKFYNPTSGTLTARLGLLCLGTKTGGELAVKDVVNTAYASTTTPDATTSDDSSSVTFRATAATGSTDPAPAPAPTPAPAAPAAPSSPAPSSSSSSSSSAGTSSSADSSGASASPRVAVVTVAKKALRLAGTSARPTVPVTLTCAKGVACDGRAQLVATSKVRGTKIKRGAVLASAPVTIKAGRKATVRLKAKKGAAAKALRGGEVKKAKVVVTTDGSRTARTVTLRRR